MQCHTLWEAPSHGSTKRRQSKCGPLDVNIPFAILTALRIFDAVVIWKQNQELDDSEDLSLDESCPGRPCETCGCHRWGQLPYSPEKFPLGLPGTPRVMVLAWAQSYVEKSIHLRTSEPWPGKCHPNGWRAILQCHWGSHAFCKHSPCSRQRISSINMQKEAHCQHDGKS